MYTAFFVVFLKKKVLFDESHGCLFINSFLCDFITKSNFPCILLLLQIPRV